MQVIDTGNPDAAGGYKEDRVLDSLEVLNKGGWAVGEPNRNCIHEKGPYKGHIVDKCGFHLLTPVGTSKGLEDIDTGWGLGD